MTDYAGWRWHVRGFSSQGRFRKTIAIAVVALGFGAGALLAQTAAGDAANQNANQTGPDQQVPSKPSPGEPMPDQVSPDQSMPDQSVPNQTSPNQAGANQPQQDQSAPAWSENQLENLVAPIALYPDALLSQVLVASTYPLEVVEAQQWLQQNGNLQGRTLMPAAQQQNWDPSVQALVAFPDVVARLSRNVQWTTDLGNAFLAQPADVMNAVQRLRAEARDSGRLQSTPQLSVNTETQGQQSAIEIQPVNPQVIYVPNYDPYAVWGPPAVGVYPSLPYAIGSGFGAFFGTVANLAGLFPGFGGLLGPRSWGWALSWLAQALFVNNSFFSDFGFHNYGGVFRGSSVWVHDGYHRLGVPYPNRFVASRYGRGDWAARGGWRNVGGARVSSGATRQSVAPYRSGGEGFSQGERGDLRAFNAPRGIRPGSTASSFAGRTSSAGQSGRTFSPPSRTADRGFQPNRGGAESSRTLTARNSFGSGQRSSSQFSPGRMPSERGSSFARAGSSERGLSERGSSLRGSPERGSSERSSSRHGWFSHGGSSRVASSHMPRERHFSAPKVAKSHFSKPHGGGHSSGGHGGKRSHRG